MSVFNNVSVADLDKLKPLGYKEVPIANIYELVRLKSPTATLILYKSGKLLVQGQADLPFKNKFRQESGTVIGSDEVLKGDTFGGIVVAAVKADDKDRELLIKLGAVDSKTLSDKEIIPIAEKIKKSISYAVKNIYPKQYNSFNGNVTQLLNILHRECYLELKPGTHVVDKFPGCTVGDIIETKADANYVEVAAASIIARAEALKQLDDLSKKAGFTVPKGSTHVSGALKELKKRNLPFEEFVKVKFSNVKNMLKTL